MVKGSVATEVQMARCHFLGNAALLELFTSDAAMGAPPMQLTELFCIGANHGCVLSSGPSCPDETQVFFLPRIPRSLKALS